MRSSGRFLGSAGTAALVVHFFDVLAFHRFSAGVSKVVCFIVLLLFFLLQLLFDGIGQTDFFRLLVFLFLIDVRHERTPSLSVLAFIVLIFLRGFKGENE